MGLLEKDVLNTHKYRRSKSIVYHSVVKIVCSSATCCVALRLVHLQAGQLGEGVEGTRRQSRERHVIHRALAACRRRDKRY